MFAKLGSWCHRRRRSVVVLWFLALVALGAASGAIGTSFKDEFTLPDVESRTGFDILDRSFGGQGTGITGSIVFRAEQGVDDPAVREAMSTFFDDLDARDDLMVVSPYDEGAAQQIARSGPDAGKIAYAQLEAPEDASFDETLKISEDIQAQAPDIPGVELEVGGAAFAEFEEPSSEILGLAFAIVILIVAFGSVLAMGLPVGVALAGILIGSILVGLVSNLVTMPDFATILGIMIGLGVGIDYALFIVTRYRENLHGGHSIEDSTSIAIDTAGRAVTFAGTTVVISLLGMLVMGVAFVQGLAVGAALVVTVTVIASLTLLPALLGFAGERVEVTRWRGLIAAALVALALIGVGLKISPLLLGLPLAVVVLAASFAVAPLRREVPRRAARPLRDTLAYRWSRLIQRRPWPAAIIGAVSLVVLALPVLGLRLGFSDEGNYPEDTTTRQAYDLLAQGFGAGANGPLMVVAATPDAADRERVESLSGTLAGRADVAAVSPVQFNPARDTAVMAVTPRSSPQASETEDLVHDLRDGPLAASGLAEVHLGGSTASTVDQGEATAARLPLFIGGVVVLSFLLLVGAFRAPVVALKAGAMNLLSIGAAYGVVTVLAQGGWAGQLVGIDTDTPVAPFIPVMMFAVLFGLSMDYEVFLLSRIKEERERLGSTSAAVVEGLARTARVITAAALIMVAVFSAFALSPEVFIKLIGLGLATAILVDATIVRMVLVPAVMQLLGERNWWLPAPLRRGRLARPRQAAAATA